MLFGLFEFDHVYRGKNLIIYEPKQIFPHMTGKYIRSQIDKSSLRKRWILFWLV